MSNVKTSLDAQNQPSCLADVMRSCVHCENTERFETWTELEYNDGSAEPHTAGNYLVNVKYVKCLDCGEVLQQFGWASVNLNKMELVKTTEKQPKEETWYLVRCPQYSESGWEIAQWIDGEWHHGHMAQSCHKYVISYHPIPLEDMQHYLQRHNKNKRERPKVIFIMCQHTTFRRYGVGFLRI